MLYWKRSIDIITFIDLLYRGLSGYRQHLAQSRGSSAYNDIYQAST